MGLKKKAVFFTFMCLIFLFLIMIIFISPSDVFVQYKAPLQQARLSALNELYRSVDKVILPEILAVVSVQGLLAATEKIKKTGTYYASSFPAEFQAILVSPDAAAYPAMIENTLPSWLQKAEEAIITAYGLDTVRLELLEPVIVQDGAWAVTVTATGKIKLVDDKNGIAWETTQQYAVRVPLEGMPDPLWAGKGININITNHLTNVTIQGRTVANMTTDTLIWENLRGTGLEHIEQDEKIAMISALIAQRVFLHPAQALVAPSYLQRFEGGKDGDAITGIFSLADKEFQDKVGLSQARRSYVDYKFIGPAPVRNSLDYVINISDIKGIYTEFVGSPPREVAHSFAIKGFSGYKLKLDQNDKRYFVLALPIAGTFAHYTCRDEVDETLQVPLFSEPDCYYRARDLGPPMATFT